MRIAVIGAAGQTGSLAMKLASESEYYPTPVARRAGALPGGSGEVADAQDAVSLAHAIMGTDAVVLAITPAAASNEPEQMRRAAAATLEAMKAAWVRRLVVVGADGPWRSSGDPVIRFILTPILGIAMRTSMADQRSAEDAERPSEVESTAIRPARLTDGPGPCNRCRRDPSNWFGFHTTYFARAAAVVDALENTATIGAALSIAS